MLTQQFFNQLLIYINLYQHAKSQAICLICFGDIAQRYLSRTTSCWFLAQCKNLEKTIDTIPKKRRDRPKEGRTERPRFIGLFRLPPGIQNSLTHKKHRQIQNFRINA